MPQYLILKLEGDDLSNATVTAVVFSEDEPDKAIKQGFVGDGRYAIVDWDERLECDLSPGPVKATGVEDKAKRVKAAEAEAQAKG